jgi:YopX protein
MNKIKFRVRDGQKLIYQNHNGWFENVKVKGYPDLQTITLTTACKPEYSLKVEQFTTISDRIQNEIYQGDSILSNGITYKIKFSEGCFFAECQEGKRHNLITVCKNGELIQNIHQNQKP